MAKRKILVVVDMQNDFITGSLGTKEAQTIVPSVVDKIKKYCDYKYDKAKIFFTQDTHHADYLKTQEGKYLPVEHCIDGTEGWEFCDPVNEVIDSYPSYVPIKVINKETFGSTELQQMLFHNEDPSEIELIGLCTDICVVNNALILKATFPEVPITVDASCCAGVTPEKHKAALEVMKSCQVNVINEQ